MGTKKVILKAISSKHLRNMIIVTLPMLLYPLLNFVFLTSVANLASVEWYGDLVFATTISATIIALSDLGLRDYLLSKNSIQKKVSFAEYLVFPATITNVLLISIGIVYFKFFSQGNSSYIFYSLVPEIIAFGVISKVLFFMYQKDLNVTGFSKRDVFFKSTPFLIKIVIFYITHNIWLAVLCGAAFALFIYMSWLTLLWPKMTSVHCGASISYVLVNITKIWKSWYPYTLSFFSFFLYFSSDKIVVNEVLGNEALALYAAATSFISMGQILVTAIWSIYMPRVSQGKDDVGQSKFLRTGFILGVSVFLSYIIFAKTLFGIIYPDSYSYSSNLLMILAVFFVFRIPNVIYEIYWVAQDRYHQFFKYRILAGVTNLVLNLALIPIYGLIAAALTTILAEALIFVLVSTANKNQHKVLS